ncbi:unnamed protein product [Boreogadus saida]
MLQLGDPLVKKEKHISPVADGHVSCVSPVSSSELQAWSSSGEEEEEEGEEGEGEEEGISFVSGTDRLPSTLSGMGASAVPSARPRTPDGDNPTPAAPRQVLLFSPSCPPAWLQTAGPITLKGAVH